jgi:TrmH family RNA methyltransferase
LLSSSNARLAAARRLTKRRARRETGRFLAEGPQAVREALAAGAVIEVFATAPAIERYPELTADASEISERDAGALSETVTPQGVVAVCGRVDVPLGEALAGAARLVAVVVEPNEPGNLGTIIRTADAAGADAVAVVGGVDVYNGKTVRASAGSLFHLPIAVCEEWPGAAAALRAAGLAIWATTGSTAGSGPDDLDELLDGGALRGATAWVFGSEASGLPEAVIAGADRRVRVPIHGRAESLNLAATAAICLYASARAQRHPVPPSR